jgi:hypothetical protein
LVAWVDIDGDRWEDLLPGETVWRNDGGKRFLDYTDRCDLRRLRGRGASVAVADCDAEGRLDLSVTRASPHKVDSCCRAREAAACATCS